VVPAVFSLSITKTPRGGLGQYAVGIPMERVAMDLLGPLPESRRGNTYLLVASDYFTRWVEAYPLPNSEAITVAQVFIEEFISRYCRSRTNAIWLDASLLILSSLSDNVTTYSVWVHGCCFGGSPYKRSTGSSASLSNIIIQGVNPILSCSEERYASINNSKISSQFRWSRRWISEVYAQEPPPRMSPNPYNSTRGNTRGVPDDTSPFARIHISMGTHQGTEKGLWLTVRGLWAERGRPGTTEESFSGGTYRWFPRLLQILMNVHHRCK
jgi:hypothetical protein